MSAQSQTSDRHPGHATGPRTPEGKRRVSRTAIAHGLTCLNVLLPEDNRANFEHFRHAMIADGQPVGGDEQNCVEQMIAAQWRLSPLWRQEGDVYGAARARFDDEKAEVGACLVKDLRMEKAFVQLARQEASLHRHYHRASRRPQELQALRRQGLRHVADEALPEAPAGVQAAAQPSASSAEASGKIAQQTPPPQPAAAQQPTQGVAPAPGAAPALGSPTPPAAPRDSPGRGRREKCKTNSEVRGAAGAGCRVEGTLNARAAAKLRDGTHVVRRAASWLQDDAVPKRSGGFINY